VSGLIYTMFLLPTTSRADLPTRKELAAKKNITYRITHGKNDFVERSKILAGYKSEKQFCRTIKVIM